VHLHTCLQAIIIIEVNSAILKNISGPPIPLYPIAPKGYNVEIPDPFKPDKAPPLIQAQLGSTLHFLVAKQISNEKFRQIYLNSTLGNYHFNNARDASFNLCMQNARDNLKGVRTKIGTDPVIHELNLMTPPSDLIDYLGRIQNDNFHVGLNLLQAVNTTPIHTTGTPHQYEIELQRFLAQVAEDELKMSGSFAPHNFDFIVRATASLIETSGVEEHLNIPIARDLIKHVALNLPLAYYKVMYSDTGPVLVGSRARADFLKLQGITTHGREYARYFNKEHSKIEPWTFLDLLNMDREEYLDWSEAISYLGTDVKLIIGEIKTKWSPSDKLDEFARRKFTNPLVDQMIEVLTFLCHFIPGQNPNDFIHNAIGMRGVDSQLILGVTDSGISTEKGFCTPSGSGADVRAYSLTNMIGGTDALRNLVTKRMAVKERNIYENSRKATIMTILDYHSERLLSEGLHLVNDAQEHEELIRRKKEELERLNLFELIEEFSRNPYY
jgi:hypothetical protein